MRLSDLRFLMCTITLVLTGASGGCATNGKSQTPPMHQINIEARFLIVPSDALDEIGISDDLPAEVRGEMFDTAARQRLVPLGGPTLDYILRTTSVHRRGRYIGAPRVTVYDGDAGAILASTRFNYYDESIGSDVEDQSRSDLLVEFLARTVDDARAIDLSFRASVIAKEGYEVYELPKVSPSAVRALKRIKLGVHAAPVRVRGTLGDKQIAAVILPLGEAESRSLRLEDRVLLVLIKPTILIKLEGQDFFPGMRQSFEDGDE